MFKINPKLKRLDLPAQSILRLQRSLGDVQTAFPGWPSQRATAYVCAFSTEKGARVAVAFYMKESCELVFYLNDEGDVARSELSKIFTDGVYFAESLGFMLGDLNLNLPDAAERDALWASLPLYRPPSKTAPLPAAKPLTPVESPPEAAVKPEEPKAVVKPVAKAAVARPVSPSGQDTDLAPAPSAPPRVKSAVATEGPRNGKTTPTDKAGVVELDLGLSRRTPLVALRRRKEPPSAEELEQKRKHLRENLGRFLASM